MSKVIDVKFNHDIQHYNLDLGNAALFKLICTIIKGNIMQISHK